MGQILKLAEYYDQPQNGLNYGRRVTYRCLISEHTASVMLHTGKVAVVWTKHLQPMSALELLAMAAEEK